MAKHQESQAEIREVFQSRCEQDTDILHSGYSDQGREGLPTNYPDFDCAFFYNSVCFHCAFMTECSTVLIGYSQSKMIFSASESR